MSGSGKFATCLNCMDGRVQEPAIKYIKDKYKVDYVDMITEAGMDRVLSENSSLDNNLSHKIDISLNLHGSKLIFVVGHYDCGGHPVDDETHKSDIRKSVENLKKLYFEKGINIYGLWIDSEWNVVNII